MHRLALAVLALTLACLGCTHSGGARAPRVGDGWTTPPTIPAPTPASTPILQPAWSTAAWFVDPSNATGCASDSNTGTSATCGGGTVGPLLTFQQLNVQRWGCAGNPRACPRLRQTTTITFLSSHTSNADPVILYPSLEAGASLLVVGNLGATQQAATGTLTTVTAKNRATPQLLQSTHGFGTSLLSGQLVVNSTHASRAMVYAGGSPAKFTQPLAVTTLPLATASTLPAEVDTWANGDTVTLYNLAAVDLVDLRPIVADYAAGAGGGLYLSQLTTFDPAGVGNDAVYVGPHVYAYDVRFDRGPFLVEEVQTDTYGIFSDCYDDGGFYGGPTVGQPLVITGGTWSSVSTNFTYTPGNAVALDGDFIFNPAVSSFAGARLGLVYLEAGRLISLTAGVSNVQKMGGGYASAILWGTGGLTVSGQARMHYDGTQGGGATGMFLQTGAFSLDGGAGLCTTSNASTSLVAGNSSSGGGLTGAALDAACGTTGYGGIAFVLGGASITKGI